MALPLTSDPAEQRELLLLLDLIFERSGLDFRAYAVASLRRRLRRLMMLEGVKELAALRLKAAADPSVLHRLVAGITVHVSGLFRDPGFFAAFRGEAERLRTYPYLRFWVAGCACGEEAYTLAILLHEEDLYARSRIYATDISTSALERAQEGVYPLAAMQDYTRNYQRSGGRAAFADYYTADDQSVLIRPFLRSNIVFAAHNLATDASFNEFHGIFCRNVMIYFNRSLQEKVLRLLYDSLVMWGYLGLGRSETLKFTPWQHAFEAINARERLFRKIA